MSSSDNADDLLDFNALVTPQDVAALRRLHAESSSWLLIDWRVLDALVPPGSLARRPIAQDDWAPFSLGDEPKKI